VANIDRVALQTVLNEFFAKDGMPEHVKDWFSNERDFYRDGDWNSFSDRAATVWQMRLDRATESILDLLDAAPAAPAGSVSVVFTDAELVHLGSDLQTDTRAKIGPRLSGALKVVTAAQKLIDTIPAGT
jgi:hypothetical protein